MFFFFMKSINQQTVYIFDIKLNSKIKVQIRRNSKINYEDKIKTTKN